MLDPIEKLLIEQECRDLTARYADACNRWNLDDFIAVFTEDAVWQRPEKPPMNGHGEIRAFMETVPTDRVMRHINGHALITADSESTAHGISTTTVYTTRGTRDIPAPIEGVEMIVEYRDQFEKTPAGWLIARRDTTVVFAANPPD